MLITTVYSIHAGDVSMPKESLEGWSKIFRVCNQHKKTFFTNKDAVRCIASYDLERGIYKWMRIQIDPTQESFIAEEVVTSSDPFEIYKTMEKKYLQEQAHETDLLAAVECIQETKAQT